MKDAIQRNLKGPRFRASRLNTLSKEWVSELVSSEKCPIKDEEVVKNILRSVNESIVNAIIEYRDGVELPEQLGYIFLGTCQPKIRKNVDFKTTDHYLKVIQHRNWESDNYLAKIFYTNYGTKYKFKFHDVWGFKGCRTFTRTVGAEYPKNWKKYIQVDHSLHVSRLYRHYLKDVNRAVIDRERLDDYNPLEL
jgi:hypothetical protein